MIQFLQNFFNIALANSLLASPFLVAVVASWIRRRRRGIAIPSDQTLWVSLLVPLVLPWWTAIVLGSNETMPAGADTTVAMRVLELLAILATFTHIGIWIANRESRALNAWCAVAGLAYTGIAFLFGSATIMDAWP